MERAGCELSRLVREVVEGLAGLAEHDEVPVTLERRARARVAGSRAGLSRAVANVVQNAIEHSPHGRPVSVRVLADAGYAIVDVHDDGPGIPPDLRARVFEPFYSTRVGAAGLGLAVTDSVVRAHGGRVRVLDAHADCGRVSSGCTVRIELPRLVVEPPVRHQIC